MKTLSFFPKLEAFFEKIKSVEPTERHRAEREKIASYIASEMSVGRQARLIFICTHNSRRSQLAEFWASALSFRLEVSLAAFSGGTSVTALYPEVADSLKRSGATVKIGSGENPVYEFFFADGKNPTRQFSKIFDDRENPQERFAAVMLCSNAEQNCPFVSGADARFSLPFDDPKAFDETDRKQEAYNKTSIRIAAEIFDILKQSKMNN